MTRQEGLDPEIERYYSRGREHERLRAGHGLLEFERTMDILGRHLPPPPGRILDVGGGPGPYARALLDIGYDVVLVDPMPLHVEQARAAGVLAARVGDARKLSDPAASFDAVLLLGPLYHLVDRNDRIAALHEAARVVRPGGFVAAAGISRVAPLLDGLMRGFVEDADFEMRLADTLSDGVHRNPTRREGWFTTAYMHRHEELAAEAEEAGWRLVATYAVEGPAVLLADVDDRLADPSRRAALLRTIARVEQEPAFLDVTGHLLTVAERP